MDNKDRDRQMSFQEKVSLFIARSPEKAILLGILIFNLIFFCVSSLVISWLTPQKEIGFWESAYGTITMILDPGCIQNVIPDISAASAVLVVTCLVIVFIGMITFTGAVIGYISNLISGYISNANNGNGSLKISNHTVILNWNSRASEIVNDLLYSEQKEHVVILVSDNREKVIRDVSDRISDTLARENSAVIEAARTMSWFASARYVRRHRMRSNITVIVRTGDIYSTKHLSDICVDTAKTIVILGKDVQNNVCRYEVQTQTENQSNGNYNTVKALIQVADMTAAENSADNQKIVVEVEDDWTLSLVEQIISHKEKLGKCNIVPVPINRVLGQILSQFCVMPELNRVYSELFSNKGAFFASEKLDGGYTKADETAYMDAFLKEHREAVPVSFMEAKEGLHAFFMVGDEKAVFRKRAIPAPELRVSLNRDFWLEKKNIIILGHNSKMDSLIAGFNAFRSEWNFSNGEEILNILMIDDEKTLKKYDFYQNIPYIHDTVTADVYDKERIYSAIRDFVASVEGEISILILSDDKAVSDDIDAKALTYLIYVHDIVAKKIAEEPDFRPKDIDIIVEVLNPKNSEVVQSYSVNNVVMSNRYISKMITQIGEKEAIFEFYNDILTYDAEESTERKSYESKELYVKKVTDFFTEIPGKCTAQELIRAIFDASPAENKAYCLGYVRNETEVTFFSGDQSQITVELLPIDKLIVFSCH